MRKLTKWLKLMPALLGCFSATVEAQAQARLLTLEQANDQARKNYPLIKQQDLIRKTADINVANLNKGFLPQVSVLGQASYQSDVTEVKIPVPGINIDPLSKDQYKLVADINQTIYDGGITREQRNIQVLNATVEQQKIEVELFKLRERINQLYLSILYTDEQLKQVELIKTDINNGIKRVEAQVSNGTAFRSNLSVLEAELLKADQRAIEVKSTRLGLVQALGIFLNETLPGDVQLEMPGAAPVNYSSSISRPELKLFTSQDKLLARQNNVINARNLPKASLFLQSGYGRPGLNFLKNEFDFYYVGGVRLNWSLGGLYTQKKDRALIDLNRKSVDIQKETFLMNTRASLAQQQAEIEKLNELLVTDVKIIELRSKVKDASKAQLENGVITANDYLREINAEDQARQSYIAHQLQLLQAHINYKTISGN